MTLISALQTAAQEKLCVVALSPYSPWKNELGYELGQLIDKFVGKLLF